MKKSFDEYTLLHNGRRKGSLWLGADHLLIIEKMSLFGALRETYRRIDYDRIQAVLTAKTRTSLYLVIMLSIFTALLGLALYFALVKDMTALVWVYGIILGPTLLKLVIRLARGSSGSMIVRTAVRPWKLAPIMRLKDAEKVAAALSARCVEFQGGELDVMTGLADAVETSLVAPPPLPAHLIPVDEDTIPPHGSLGWGYVSLAVFGLMIAGEAYLVNHIYTYGLLAAGAVAMTLLAMAVSRRGGLASTGSRAAWLVSAALLGITGISGYVIAMMGTVSARVRTGTQPDMVGSIASFPSAPDSGGAIFLLVLGTAMLASAVFGLLAAARRRARLQVVGPGDAGHADRSGFPYTTP